MGPGFESQRDHKSPASNRSRAFCLWELSVRFATKANNRIKLKTWGIRISKGFNFSIEWLRGGVGTPVVKEVKDTGVSQAEREQIELRRLFYLLVRS